MELEALWAAVYEEPDDDHRRQLLADALLEQGDPRGEFITLQLQPDLDAKGLKRAQALVRKHAKLWLGPIAAVVPAKDAVFRRGFLSECTANARKDEDADVAFGVRDWATVERLDFKPRKNGDPGIARLTPAMRRIRELSGLPVFVLRALAEPGWSHLERLHVRENFFSLAEARASGLDALAGATLPKLRELTLLIGYSESTPAAADSKRGPAELAFLKSASWMSGLERLTVSGFPFDTPNGWFDVAHEFTRGTLTLSSEYIGLELSVADLFFTLDVRTQALELAVKLPFDEPRTEDFEMIERALKTLGPARAVTRFALKVGFTVPDEWRARLRAALAQTGWAVEL